MENHLRVTSVEVEGGGSLTCSFEVEGPWSNVFLTRKFTAVYSEDISAVPESVLIVPFLANVLPVAWVFDAVISADEVDEDFHGCLESVRRGYEKMYPALKFGGLLQARKISASQIRMVGSPLAFFSGGVDAFQTLIAHLDEKPCLFTVWGADVPLDDSEGWRRVEEHQRAVAEDFSLGRHTVVSNLRSIVDEHAMWERVKAGGDGWWHGFQHGLGLLGLAAPVSYLKRVGTIYIASSFTAADRGRATCASDPSIDNNVSFCGTRTWHDGYDLTRQEKIRNLVRFSRSWGKPIRIRVCWESEGGSNCSHCEKCLRTILALYAEKAEPRNFGFDYDDFDELGIELRERFPGIVPESWLNSQYAPQQRALRSNYSLNEVSPGWQWFYEGDVEEMGRLTFFRHVLRKLLKIRRSARVQFRRLNGR